VKARSLYQKYKIDFIAFHEQTKSGHYKKTAMATKQVLKRTRKAVPKVEESTSTQLNN